MADSNLIFLQANTFVGAGATSAEVYQGLEEAAAQARALGTAIIFVEAGRESLRALIKWGFEKGTPDVVFAPISAVAKKRGRG